MLKEIYNKNRMKILGGVSIVIFLFIVLLLLRTAHSYLLSKTEDEIDLVISSLAFSQENAEQETQQLEKMLEKDYLSAYSMGHIYKALAELTYMSGNEAEYNANVGYASFYFERSKDYEDLIALYTEYIGRLYANGSYDAAEKLLLKLNQIKDLDTFENKKALAAYYLSFADVEEMLNHFEETEYNLEKAKAAITQIEDKKDRQLQQAKYDMLLARLYLLQGNTEKTKELLNNYQENDTLELPEDNLYRNCDFLIPYYEINIKLMLSEDEDRKIYHYLDQYIELCDTYNFRIMKLNLLRYVITHTDDSSQQIEQYVLLEREATNEGIVALAKHYGEALLGSINETTVMLEDQEKEEQERQSLAETIVIALIIFFVAVIVIYFIVEYFSIDTLTKLKNRSAYERVRTRFEKKKIPYQLVVLDIDDFKKINDTYGHVQGDSVLKNISAIIKKHMNDVTAAYRYGGEEICIMMKGNSLEAVKEMSENIRKEIAEYYINAPMKVTISGGIASSENGENPFQEADRNLYYSKNHGKNRITTNLCKK